MLPLLKPRGYLDSDSANRCSLVSEWLADVVICYALRSNDIFRFVTTADADRWQTNAQALHQVAVANLCRLAWPTKLEGARQRDGGRVIVIATSDGLASSRLLHPDLHRLFCGPLGSPFRAGIPDRDTLVVYSDRRRLRQRTERQLRKDHRTSSYPITPRPFLVTPDGIARLWRNPPYGVVSGKHPMCPFRIVVALLSGGVPKELNGRRKPLWVSGFA